MRHPFIFVFLCLCFALPAIAQTPREILDKVRQIKLLQSNRADVKRLLKGLEYEQGDDFDDRFSSPDTEIGIQYSSGECATDAYDDWDKSKIWKSGSWLVTLVRIEFSDPVEFKQLGVNVRGLKQDRRYDDDLHSFVLFNMSSGIAFELYKDGVNRISLFPGSGSSKQLCGRLNPAEDPYAKQARFVDSIFDRRMCVLTNLHANVTALDLSATEVEEGSEKLIQIVTNAVDPENDVLTYNYTVSAGEIRGRGPKVVWDLSKVGPGSHTITVGVDDGVGVVGQTLTRTVVVK